MEETEKAANSIYGVRDPAAESLFRKLNEELHITLPLLGQDQSLLPNREFFGSVAVPVTCPPLTSCLKESPRSSLSRNAPKIKAQERNSVRLWPCDECGKVFKKERAMYGHKRSHSVRNRKVSKKAVVIPEQKAAASVMCQDQELYTERRESRVRRRSWKTESVTDNDDIGAERTLLSESSSCASKKGGWDVRLDANISVEELASFLVDLSQSDGKTHICEKCNRSFPSEKTLHEHVFSQSVERKDEVAPLKPPTELKRKNAVMALKLSTELKRKNEVMADLKPSTGHLKSGEKKPKRPKKEPEIKSHICRECGREFTTGHQLGGHMRAHYDPAESKRKAGGRMDG